MFPHIFKVSFFQSVKWHVLRVAQLALLGSFQQEVEFGIESGRCIAVTMKEWTIQDRNAQNYSRCSLLEFTLVISSKFNLGLTFICIQPYTVPTRDEAKSVDCIMMKHQEWTRTLIFLMLKFVSYDSSTCEEYDSVEQDESNSDYDPDSDVETCSCIGCQTENSRLDETGSLDGDDLYSVHVDVKKADPLCIKLNDLIREKICTGPMNLGDGRHSHINKELDKKVNLGKLSESLILKSQAGYTPDSSVIKPLSLAHVELLKNSGAKPLIETTNVVVIPCALANDGTALKPTIKFDACINKNVGLVFPVDLDYVKKNPTSSPDHLIVTEAIVSSLTYLDNFSCSLPIAVDYTTKSGKTGQTMLSYFEEHAKKYWKIDIKLIVPVFAMHSMI
ncbi:Hypothetical predicted protein [Paramuricea clavata]|uniref:Uncharacterized protein n=1 Tax=Paramuricea clavata TaxID=317549 RepID=A0A6S7HII7_PARCT|nr:Hypothetical predicted protein [Paramuricea clavata]